MFIFSVLYSLCLCLCVCRFVHDNQFWRYTGQINNAFGSESYSIRISCRTIFTDPDIHQRLHDTHVKKYSSYFGYWYKQDLYTYDPQVFYFFICDFHNYMINYLPQYHLNMSSNVIKTQLALAMTHGVTFKLCKSSWVEMFTKVMEELFHTNLLEEE